jgi:hypothetical protein
MTFESKDRQGAEFSHLLDQTDEPATSSTLASIVARSRRRRERRLKVITGVSIVVALAGASVAGITRATNGITATSKTNATPSQDNRAPSTIPAWTKQHQTLGAAPKGLQWSLLPAASAKAGVSSVAPNSVAPNAAGTLPGADVCTAGSCGVRYPVDFGGPMTKLFIHTSSDVTARAFDEKTIGIAAGSGISSGSPSPASLPASATTPSGATGSSAAPVQGTPIYSSCESSQALVVEVSNPGAVGTITVSLPSISISEPGQPFNVIDSTAVGVAESTPIEVLTVHVASDVKSVQANFADGTSDQMNVIDGWAVVIDDGNAPLPATINALDGSGGTVGTASVNDADAIAQPQSCLVPFEHQPQLGSGTVQPKTGSK